MDRTLLSLNGEWALYYAPEKGGKEETFRPDMLQAWPRVKANVPGNCERALVDAGVMGDPYWDEQQLDAAKYEYYQWIYETGFDAPAAQPGARVFLRFDGIDTIADIYLNGAHLLRAENMFVEHEADVTNLLREADNRLIVHIHSAMNYARSREYPIGMRGTAHRNEICHIRKAAHSFGWDIAPRLVTSGLWRGVRLIEKRPTRITETYYAVPEVDRARDTALLEYAFRFETDADTLEGFSARLTGVCGAHTFERETPVWFVSHNCEMTIDHPLLWWPQGYGAQNLYTVTLELLRDGEVVDSVTERIGLRSLSLERSFERGSQKFQISVNGVRLMVRGTNWVPLDAMHGNDQNRVDAAMALIHDCGCNMLRSWGGGVYESDRFFDLCDEYGVLVWQDFCMGNTNYPQDDAFARVMYDEASHVARRIRNHASLALWSGDNEVDHKNMGFHLPTYDARYNRVTHETLVRALQAHDPYRFFLRSSPEIPDGFRTDDVPEQHTWGPRAFYKDDFYKHSSASFIGEAGYHGCPSPDSLAEFLPAEKLWPMDNRAWAIHSTEDVRIESRLGGRNRLMADQVRLLCRQEPDGLNEFARISQLSQAEAVKFFIEHTRSLKWRRSGIIWWNMIDCWPQISDAVVDYAYRKKLAYDWIRRAQQPRIAMMDEVSGWQQAIVLANDTLEAADFRWRVEDADTSEVLASGERTVPAGENAEVGRLTVDPSQQRLLLLRWTANGEAGVNHYLTGFPKYDKADLLRWADAIQALA